MKNLGKLVVSLSVLIACSNLAFADGNAFTPLNFDDAYTPVRTSAVTTSNTSSQAAIKPVEQIGNKQFQNAITQLESAQVEVRNDLLNIKTKFSDVDAKYQAISTERKALKKEIKSLERKINKIDKQKESIRKNMI